MRLLDARSPSFEGLDVSIESTYFDSFGGNVDDINLSR